MGHLLLSVARNTRRLHGGPSGSCAESCIQAALNAAKSRSKAPPSRPGVGAGEAFAAAVVRSRLFQSGRYGDAAQARAQRTLSRP
eukprot:1588277-Pleurochrysis_carterae.AAC.1